jgi:hypothetical protein
MRAAKAEAAKEEARVAEIKRRAEAGKSAEAKEALLAAAKRADEEARKREKARVERESLFQRLELAKERAERESARPGGVTPETAANLKFLQDKYDGKADAVAPGDPLLKIKANVGALTLQKSEDIGLTAAKTIALLLGKVLDAPGDAKFRRIPWVVGKAAHARIAPASAGIGLLLASGWVREGDGADVALVLPADANLDLVRAAAADIAAAVDGGKFQK